MRKIVYFLAVVFGTAFMLTSCEKTVTFDDTRKKDNEAQFTKISNNPEYTKIESASGGGYIMYKKIKSGGTGVKPAFTDRVEVLYTGWFKRFWSKPDTYTGDDGNVFNNKVIFDSTANRNDNPSLFQVNGNIVDGFATALQHMEVGDKWEIWIPWTLGYGATGKDPIAGYSTLVFEVELLKVL